MTIQSPTNRVLLSCDGTTKTFNVAIQAYQSSDFEVILTAPLSSGGAQTTLVLNSDYSMATSGSLSPTQWTLTTLAAAAYAAGYTLQVILAPVETQASQYVQGQAFPSAAVQANLDRLTQMVLRLQDQVSRSFVAPDGDVSPLVTLPSARARSLSGAGGGVPYFDANGNLQIGVVPSTALTQAVFNALLAAATLFPLTPGEIATSITPTNFSDIGLPIADARRYGFGATGNTAAQNLTALQNAITAVAQVPGSNGGTVQLPPGSYPLPATGGVVIPPGVAVRGCGKRATYITWAPTSGSPVLFQLGNSSTSTAFGTALSDLTVQLTGTLGIICLLYNTVGGEVSRCYFEGETISAGRTTQGVVIDAASGVLGSFFNHVTDVECAHLHVGFQQKSSGSTQPTQNHFTNCNAVSDVGTDTTCVGIQHGDGVTAGVGQLSVYEHIDLESCGVGVHCYAAVGPATWVGVRFEGNTTDILYDANAAGQCWFGTNAGLSTGLVTDNTGDFRNRYFGTWDGGNNQTVQRHGLARFGANVATDVPMRVDMAPSQTGNLWEARNSSGNLVGGISPAASGLAPGLRPFDVAGISGTGTPANNLRGTATFAAATSVAVSFATAEPDASYLVALGGNAAGYCWVTAKGTGGFTINCSAANSNSTDWHLLR